MTAGSIAVPTIVPLRIPVGPKHVIDTQTKIELASDSEGSVVFYTLEGSRPQPFRGSKVNRTRSSTLLYGMPFFLCAGKVTIKAIASTKDLFKESSVVTRTFTVKDVGLPESSEESDEEEEPKSAGPAQPRSLSAQLRHRLDHTSLTGIFSGTGSIANYEAGSTDQLPVNLAESRDLLLAATRPAGRHAGARPSSSGGAGSEGSLSLRPDPSSRTVGRPATIPIPNPICPFCNAQRSKDHKHRFCTNCGCELPPLPEVDPAPPLQVARCPQCRAHLPLGSSACLICEHPLQDPLPIPVIQAQAQSKNGTNSKDKEVCLACGTRNSPGAMTCYTCEVPFPSSSATPPHPPRPPSPLAPLPEPPVLRPVSGSSYMMCGRCGRVNVSDARFCDWCGSKPGASQLSVQCSSCTTANDWHYRHCYACGNIIKAPLRPDVELSATMKMPANIEVDKEAWIPVVEIEDKGPVLRNIGTQTQGLFFPSSRTIGNQKGSEFMKKVMFLTSQDRKPKLQNYSPGKGLWRVQVEHVVTHLKAHAQSSSSFQAAIGSPQMGKLLSAEVTEGKECVDVQLSFTTHQREEGKAQSASLERTRSYGGVSASSSTDSISASNPSKKKTKPKVARPLPHKGNPSAETVKLLQEVSRGGQGRRDVIKSLIDQGADVNAVSADKGLPVLSLAASNVRVNCITLLAENGALLNAQAKATGNTALHEAVLRGTASIPVIETLLSLRANPKVRNSSGLTPCDVALKLKQDEVVTCFATYIGAGLMDSLCKHQPSPSLTL